MSFEQITQGPSGPSGQNSPCSPNGLTLDQLNNVVASVGSAGTEAVMQRTLATIRAQAALTAITTAQTLLTSSLKAYFLDRAGRTLRVKGSLVYSTTDSAVATITISLLLGTTTLCSIATAATNTAASVNLPIAFEFWLSVGLGGKISAVSCHGAVDANIGTAAAAAIARYLDANVDAIDTITIGTNPAVGDTVTVNGTVVTFIVNGGTPVGNQVALGTTATATATALYTFLAASVDANIVKATYTNPTATKVAVTSAVAGFVPAVSTSVPAKISFSNPTIDTTAALDLKINIATGVAAVPSAQLNWALIDLLA